MADRVISLVLDKLAKFLREEATLFGGLEDDVQKISIEFAQMKNFLNGAEAKEADDPILRERNKQVRDAAYDVEDVLDEFAYRFAHNPSTGGFCDCVRRAFEYIKNLRARHQLASEIKSIQSRISDIHTAYQRYQSEHGSLVAVNHRNTSHHRRDDPLLEKEANLVGIEMPKQELISRLLNDGNSQFKVISVVGMGGLGKTTLVKKVYEEVKEHFRVYAWVTVSKTVGIETSLKNLIQELKIPPTSQSMTTVDLKDCVKNFLQKKGRYLIVFDDVWDMEFWGEIKFALPENNCGSRVMLTTRNVNVAKASCIESGGYVHEMQPLSLAESWTLFCNRTFKRDCCPAHLKDIARGILDKCDCLPLAIVTISGLLALKDESKFEWEKVERKLRHEFEGSPELGTVLKILSLSYNDLSSLHKSCLLHLSIYPEDYEIDCRQLIRLWIAERFVEQREGMTTEDEAWDYLRELINRSLIQVVECWYGGIPYSCRIHDLIREVIISKSKEQNMVVTAVNSATQPIETVRRLVIHGSGNFHPNSNNNMDHLRSLFTSGSVEKTLLSKVLYCSNRQLLKILDLREAQMFEEIPDEIFNLFRLNYLSLYRTSVKTVSKSIGKLKDLEFLNLGETEVRELPVEILRLQKLQYLWVYGYVDDYRGFKAPSNIGRLLALQSLGMVDIAAVGNEETSSAGIVEEIGKLKELRELEIRNIRREDANELCSSLANLTNLEKLCVSSFNYEVIDLNHHHYSSMFLQSLQRLQLTGGLEKMPQWITCLQGLVRLDLIHSRLREDPLEALQNLPCLAHLNLYQAYQGEQLCFRSGGFPKLKKLWLRGLEGLTRMAVDKGAMSCLNVLELSRLPLVELPSGLQYLTQLRKLQLLDLSSQLVGNLMEKSDQELMHISHTSEISILGWTNGGWRWRQLWGKRKT